MKSLSVVIALSLLLMTGLAKAQDDLCMDLLEAVIGKVSADNVPAKVKAGQKLTAHIKWDLKSTDILGHWDDIELTPMFWNRIPGSYAINTPLIGKTNGRPIMLTSDVTFDIPKNLVGLYEFAGVKFIARSTNDPKLCYSSRVTPANLPKFVVENELSNVDIFPPELSRFRFESETAKPGETVRLIFSAQDQSAICTKDKEDEGKCVGHWHESVTTEDGLKWVYFDAPLSGPSNGEYFFSFKIPENAEPATYRLNQIFVRDVLDNFIVSPDVSARPKLTID
jgi:hypothetical protein